MVRSCYRTDARFFTDDPSETEITWYFVPRDRPWLPLKEGWGFTNANWDNPDGMRTESGFVDAPGEVVGSPRTWMNGAEPNPAPFTGHICGSQQQWIEGTPLPPDPPVVHDCCNPPPLLRFRFNVLVTLTCDPSPVTGAMFGPAGGGQWVIEGLGLPMASAGPADVCGATGQVTYTLSGDFAVNVVFECLDKNGVPFGRWETLGPADPTMPVHLTGTLNNLPITGVFNLTLTPF